MKTIKFYRVSPTFSLREINDRSRKEAIAIFSSQLRNIVSDCDKIKVM